jgi:hypothetical protein
MTGTFPTSLMSGPHIQVPKETLESLYWYLPNAEQAAHLRDVYFQYAAWMYVFIGLGGDIGAAETDRGCRTGTTPFHSTNSTRKSTFRFTRLARSRWTTHSSAIVSRFFLWCLPSAARWTLRFLPTTLTRRSAYSLLFNARIRLVLDQSCAVLSIELHRFHIMPCLRPAQTSYGRDEAINSD